MEFEIKEVLNEMLDFQREMYGRVGVDDSYDLVEDWIESNIDNDGILSQYETSECSVNQIVELSKSMWEEVVGEFEREIINNPMKYE